MPRTASEVEPRRVRTHELAAVGALTVAGYEHDGYLTRDDGWHDDEYAGWLLDAAGRARDAVVVVAAQDDRLLGTVTWCPPGSPLREVATRDDQGEIRTLAVSPDARGRGVGATLTAWCLAEARATGLREVVLSSLAQMEPAHRLYRRHGFVRRPELDWSPHPAVPLHAFSLDLRLDLG